MYEDEDEVDGTTYAHGRNPNSALVWFPLLRNAGLPVPRTLVVRYDHVAAVSLLEAEEQEPEYHMPVREVTEAAAHLGYPVFLRSDLASAKHDDLRSFKVERADGVMHALMAIVQDGESKFWLEPGAGPEAFLVRKWLDLDGGFTAFGGITIAREFRFIVEGSQVRCWHPYWPEDAMRGVEGFTTSEWKWLLEQQNVLSEREYGYLEVLAQRAGLILSQVLPAWSVDFARDRDGTWWLIDVADAERSWHPEHEETDGGPTEQAAEAGSSAESGEAGGSPGE